MLNDISAREIIFRLYHKIIGSRVLECLRELQETQWLTLEEIRSLQYNKLIQLLRHAYQNVPFYRERFRDCGIDERDLGDHSVIMRIPLLSKREINANREKMISRDHHSNGLIRNSTSGSTGEALYFYTDRRSWAYRRAAVIRNESWLGIKPADKVAKLWGARMDIEKLENIRGRIHRFLLNYKIYSSYDLSPPAFVRMYQELRRFRPKLLVSYPGPLVEFAKWVIEQGGTLPSLRAIISSAETLYPWQKEVIEMAFRCKVYNRYGCREFGDIAHECERREGLHINAERVYVEILKEDGSPCEAGEAGEIVITDLDNYGMPLIRYRIQDIGVLSMKICSCGRGLPLLDRVDGRTLDVVKTPSGKRIGGTFWTLLFRSRPGISAFQIYQHSINRILVKYVRDAQVTSVPLDYFEGKIKETCGSDFTVTFEEVPEIEKTASGKSRFIVSNLDEAAKLEGRDADSIRN